MTYDANSANRLWKMEHSFVYYTHYIPYFPKVMYVFCVSYMKKGKKSREHNTTYERLSPKILSFSFSSCVQHVIHTVSTNSINATTHTGYNISNHQQSFDAKGSVWEYWARRTFTKLAASYQTDNWHMAEVQETCESVFRQAKLAGGRRDGRTHGESHNVTHVVEAPMPSISGGKLFAWSNV